MITITTEKRGNNSIIVVVIGEIEVEVGIGVIGIVRRMIIVVGEEAI